MSTEASVSPIPVTSRIRLTGDAATVRGSLLQQLNALAIDADAEVADLPRTNDGDVQAVKRLVSVARSHGHCVEMVSQESESLMKVVKPANVRLLQDSDAFRPSPPNSTSGGEKV